MFWKTATAVLALLALAEGGLLVKSVIDENKEPPVATLATDAVLTRVDAKVARRLAERFRPYLKFDSKEPWRPLAIGYFLAEGGADSHRLCDRSIPRQLANPKECPAIESADSVGNRVAELARRGENLVIDIDGDKANGLDYATADPTCITDPALLDCNEGPHTAIYYRVQAANARYYVDYWWFYRFNDFPKFDLSQQCDEEFRPLCGDHEGDWEGVTVVTSALEPERIEYVAYAAHDGTYRYTSSQIDKVDGTRPVVYVARGSHASYPTSCDKRNGVLGCKQVGSPLPEGRHNGDRDWGRNDEKDCDDDPDVLGFSDCLRVLPTEIVAGTTSWNAYAGLWGRVCIGAGTCPVMRGPRSPSRQGRFLSPWCAHPVVFESSDSKKETCDALPPAGGDAVQPGVGTTADCRSWAGAAAAVTACDAQTLAEGLASGEDSEAPPISIEAVDPSGEVTRARSGETVGVAQLVAEPLRSPSRVVVRGHVSDIFVTAQNPKGRSRDAREAFFGGVGLGPEQEATVRIRYRQGRVQIRLLLPNGAVRKPDGKAS